LERFTFTVVKEVRSSSGKSIIVFLSSLTIFAFLQELAKLIRGESCLNV